MWMKRKPTIARVIARLNVGGPAQQAILMTDAFRRRGYRTLLFTGEVSPGEGDMGYLAQERDVYPISISTLSRRISFIRDLKSLWRLTKFFRQEKPLVVHTHTAKAGTVGRLAALLAGIPVRVHTFHGHVFQGYFSQLLTRIFVIIERRLARCTDCIVSISESQCKELVETYRIAPADKVVTIPLGFDLEPFLSIQEREGSLRGELRCATAAGLVGWVGRLTTIKAPELFLDCAGLIYGQSPNTRFAMIGDGELRHDCEDRIQQLGLSRSVRLRGWQRHLAPIYADIDLLLLTSLNEGTPLALVEAMASGRPFIATDVGAVRDLMTGVMHKEQGWQRFDNGILVPRDARVMAQAAHFLLANPELRREMGLAGREFVRTRYSQDRLADELESLYLRLAESKKTSRDLLPLTISPATVSSGDGTSSHG